MNDAPSEWRWVEASVDRSGPYLRLVHDDFGPSVVALVGPPQDNVFAVEFLLTGDGDESNAARILADVRAELDMYLLEVGGPDPWAYAHYHCGQFSNAYGNVHWGVGEEEVGVRVLDFVGDFWGGDYTPLDEALAPLVEEAWSLHHKASSHGGQAVQPSMPILFFGDLHRYWGSARRVITVGLNPSGQEFPADDPWKRFPGGAKLDETSLAEHRVYLEELSRYFRVAPYRKWFEGSFEPLLHGLGASYYAGAASTAPPRPSQRVRRGAS